MITAEWCEFCQEIKPQIEEFKKKKEVQEIELSKEKREFVKKAYNIPCIPALIILDDEENIVDTWHADLQESFEEFTDKYL